MHAMAINLTAPPRFPSLPSFFPSLLRSHSPLFSLCHLLPLCPSFTPSLTSLHLIFSPCICSPLPFSFRSHSSLYSLLSSFYLLPLPALLICPDLNYCYSFTLQLPISFLYSSAHLLILSFNRDHLLTPFTRPFLPSLRPCHVQLHSPLPPFLPSS